MAEGAYGDNVRSFPTGGFSGSPGRPLANPTEPPDPPDMDDLIRRVGKIEDMLARLEPLITRIDERLKMTATSTDLADLKMEVKTDVAAINGKLTHMPTLWQIVPLMLGINAAVLGLAAWVAHLLK